MATITTYSGTPPGSIRIGDASANTYNAQQFTATASGTLTSLKFYQRALDGTPSDNAIFEVWSDSGADTPSALISGATVTVLSASIVDGGNSWDSSEFTTATFGSPPTLVNTTKYWIVMRRTGAVDAINYRNYWVTTPSSYAGGKWLRSSDGSSWNDASGTSYDVALEITITESTTRKSLTLLGVS